MGVVFNKSNTQFVIDRGEEIDRIWLDENWKVAFDLVNYQKVLPLIKTLRAKLHQANRHLENIFVYDTNLNAMPDKSDISDEYHQAFIKRIATESLILLLDSTKDILARLIGIVYEFESKNKEMCFMDFFPSGTDAMSCFNDLKTADSTLAEYLSVFNRSEENQMVTSYCNANISRGPFTAYPFTPGYLKSGICTSTVEKIAVELESLSNASMAIKIEKTYRISICTAGQLMLNYLHYKPILENYFIENTVRGCN